MAVEVGGIGARLRAGREKLGLTVLQVAERIHTDPKIVEAVEAENFEALGAPVYARGHIRHYADLVGEAAGELTAIYTNLSNVGQPDLTKIVKTTTVADSNRLVAPALMVIAVFAVAGAFWWVSALSKKKPQMSESHLVGVEGSTVSGGSPAGLAGAAGTAAADGAAGAGGSTGAAGTAGPAASPGAPGVSGTAGAAGRAGSAALPGAAGPMGPGTAGSAGGGAGASAATQSRLGAAGGGSPRVPTATPVPAAKTAPPSAASSTVAPNTPTASAATPPRARNQSQVTLHYSADSWTEVYDASGARLFYDVGAANSVQTVVGTPPLRVVLGNAAGVGVEYNGHNVPITKLSQADGSVQFFISRSGHAARTKAAADGG